MQDIAQETIDFYGEYFPKMMEAQQSVCNALNRLAVEQPELVAHIYVRIKTVESMTKKLILRGLPITAYDAATQLTDAVGFRIICRFVDDVYVLAAFIRAQKGCWTVRECKDYIANVKPNGYRSYHMIVDVVTAEGVTIPVELQLRTISQDAWASLEHQMKYKKEIEQKSLIESELKRCADEMASTDLTMQTIRDLLRPQVC